LFNFMDGIDGIAASEAVFVNAAGGALAIVYGNSESVGACAFVVAAASCGFLIWNWPPAKIFMGDAGSGYLGFIIAVLALAFSRDSPTAFSAWLILGGLFFVDATITLIGRFFRGEKVYLAHRNHIYQILSRRWNSHLRVTVTTWLVNLLWLLPLAVLACRYSKWDWFLVLCALLPLAIVAIVTSRIPESG
jgi:Fuc2NAc and GlcNAc transferase